MSEQDAAAKRLVYRSNENCWRCGTWLYELRPPIDGWRFYCRGCQHLTVTNREATALRAQPLAPNQIGHVVAVALPLDIQPL